MLAAILAPLLVAAAPAEGELKPIPLTSPGQWISMDDYPYEAMLLEQEGRVSFALIIDGSGLPKSCAITASSGVQSLDSATCSALMLRARFRPLGDTKGEAEASIYRGRINWRLPATGEAQTPTLDVHEMELVFFAEPDGTVTDCVATLNGGKPLPPSFCAVYIAGRRVVPQLDAQGHPVRQRMRMTIKVEKAAP